MDRRKPLKELTLVFCRRVKEDGSKEILLGLKKRGFGKGKWNGEYREPTLDIQDAEGFAWGATHGNLQD